jgi:hypothetical protein
MALDFSAQSLESRNPSEELSIVEQILELFGTIVVVLAQEVHQPD